MSKSKNIQKKKIKWGPIIFKGFWVFISSIMVVALLVPLAINIIDFIFFNHP